MERPVNSRVRHGMASCARYGCTQPRCLAAYRRDRQESREACRAGEKFRVASAPVTEHVKLLILSGMSFADISGKSGMSYRIVSDIFKGVCDRVYRTTAEALLGIPVPRDGCLPAVDGLVDATGARRRLRAMSLQGFPLPALSRESDVHLEVISRVRRGIYDRLMLSGMRKIVLMHERLCDSDPLDWHVRNVDAARARAWAQKQGWHPTEAWVEIDDPDCVPLQLDTPRYVILTENARELMEEQGYTRKQAAARLKVEYETLRSAMNYYKKMMDEAA